MFIPTYFVHKENKNFRQAKLAEISADVDFRDNADGKDNASVLDETPAEQEVTSDVVTVEKQDENAE